MALIEKKVIFTKNDGDIKKGVVYTGYISTDIPPNANVPPSTINDMMSLFFNNGVPTNKPSGATALSISYNQSISDGSMVDVTDMIKKSNRSRDVGILLGALFGVSATFLIMKLVVKK